MKPPCTFSGERRRRRSPSAPVALELTVFLFSRNFPGIFGNQQQHYLEVIKRMLVQCMQDQAHPQVRG